jgi:DNA-binding MarR family transcriptional regulator
MSKDNLHSTKNNLSRDWQNNHMGRLLGDALRRFDARVLQVMSRHEALPLSLAHLAGRGQLVAAHIHITRHLPRAGAGINTLAVQAGVSKQAMSALVDQCAAWGLVHKLSDPKDGRAKQVQFSTDGLLWLQAFEAAVQVAEQEFEEEVGDSVATVVRLGLEAYGASAAFDKGATKRAMAS